MYEIIFIGVVFVIGWVLVFYPRYPKGDPRRNLEFLVINRFFKRPKAAEKNLDKFVRQRLEQILKDETD